MIGLMELRIMHGVASFGVIRILLHLGMHVVISM